MEAGLNKTYADATLLGDDFRVFVDDVASYLPMTLPHKNIYDSLSHLAGERLTKEVLRDNYWRLAGNIYRLRGKAVPPWNRQPFPEWVPVAIMSAQHRRNNAGRAGYVFSFQVLAGLSCPMVLTKFWSVGFCYYVSKFVGFNRPPRLRSNQIPHGVFKNPRELVTMRLQLLIDPKLCSHSEPGFDKVRVGPSQKEWNKEQMRFRDRLDDEHACPKGYLNSRPCFLCHIGYKSAPGEPGCRAACHPDKFTTGYCPVCAEPDALFDPLLPPDTCIDCYEDRLSQRPKKDDEDES